MDRSHQQCHDQDEKAGFNMMNTDSDQSIQGGSPRHFELIEPLMTLSMANAQFMLFLAEEHFRLVEIALPLVSAEERIRTMARTEQLQAHVAAAKATMTNAEQLILSLRAARETVSGQE